MIRVEPSSSEVLNHRKNSHIQAECKRTEVDVIARVGTFTSEAGSRANMIDMTDS